MNYRLASTSTALLSTLLLSTSAMALDNTSFRLAQAGAAPEDSEGTKEPKPKAKGAEPQREKAPPANSEKGPDARNSEGRSPRKGGGNDEAAPNSAQDKGADVPHKKLPAPAANKNGDLAPDSAQGPARKKGHDPAKDTPARSDDNGPGGQPRPARESKPGAEPAPEKTNDALPPKKSEDKQGSPPPKNAEPAPQPAPKGERLEKPSLEPKGKVPQNREPGTAAEPKAEQPKGAPKAPELQPGRAAPKEEVPASRPAEKSPGAPGEPKAEPKSDLKKAPDTAPPASKEGAAPPAQRKERLPGLRDKESEVPPKPDTKKGPDAAAPAVPAQPAPGGKAATGEKQPAAAPPEVKDLKELKEERKERSEDGGKRIVIEEPDKRAIIKEEGHVIIRHDETDRFRRLSRDTRVEKRNGLDVSVTVRPGGIQIFTDLDDRGRPLRRYRRDREGREVILFDNREYYDRHRGGGEVDAIIDLPPPRVSIPREHYIVDYEEATDVEVYEVLTAPPVEKLDRRYSMEEVRRSPMLRDRMPRLDLNAITFEFGAWEVAANQYPVLERVARMMNRAIDANPSEMFLIEGHTDAVGSDEDNLSLSDRRAEAVSIILTEQFNVPPENMTTQGYGEQYLKVQTDRPEQQNRRVAVRRITPLISQR